ncbi:hypothetical protein REMIM1_CH02519 [Rhizobium etli bv. mimosae str. Mim1]|nr:hypothetical protein REMIM1_CH02519 [Rhizobium etli bv. mimosae str. Mim1]
MHQPEAYNGRRSRVKTSDIFAKMRKPRMALALRGLPRTQASSPLHGEARFLRYALPEPEKQRSLPLRPN